MLDKRIISRNFSQSARDYDKHAVLQKALANELLSLAGKLEPKRILDIGCGTGYLTRRLAETFPKAEVIGIDIAPGMIEVARNKNSRANLNFIAGDGEDIPLENLTFDLVVSNASLQWMDAKRVFAGAHKVLNPGGRFIFTTFGPQTLRELKVSGFRVNKFLSVVELKGIAGNLFSTIRLKSKIVRQRFEGVKELIYHLKEIGAQSADKRKSEYSLSAFKEYKEKFSSNGCIYATYELIYGIII